MPTGAPEYRGAFDRMRLRRMLANEADMAFKRRAEAIFEFLAIEPGDRLLDLGCGRGFFLNLIGALSPDTELVGLELERPLLTVAAPQVPGAALVNGSACHLPFADGAFDKIVFTEVLEHIPDDAAALREVARVLAPGGTVALTVPHEDYPFLWDPINKTLERTCGFHIQTGPLAGIWANHERLYSLEGLARLVASSGLAIEEVRYLTHYCFPFIHLAVYGIGKPLLERGALPGSVAGAANRFDLESRGGGGLNPVRLGLWMFNAVDRLNDLDPPGPDGSFLLIAMKLRKRDGRSE